MEYLRIDTSVFHSPEYIGATPTQRSTWLSLLGYCSIQENSGIIENCDGWGDRRWMQTCGVTLGEINEECDLWTIDALIGIHVSFYPTADEDKCIKLRKRAKAAGLASGRARSKRAEQNGSTTDEPNGSTTDEPNGSTETSTSRSKERIGEDRRGEDRELNSASLSIDDLRIHCYVGDSEAGAFTKLFKQFSRFQGLRVIRILRERRQTAGERERPCLSDLAPYITKHFQQIKMWSEQGDQP